MAAETKSPGDSGVSPSPLLSRSWVQAQRDLPSLGDPGCDSTARARGSRSGGWRQLPQDVQSRRSRCPRAVPAVRSGENSTGTAPEGPGHPQPGAAPVRGEGPAPAPRQHPRLGLCRAGSGISMETPGSGGAGSAREMHLHGNRCGARWAGLCRAPGGAGPGRDGGRGGGSGDCPCPRAGRAWGGQL